MSNVASVALQRLAGSGLTCARWPAPSQVLRLIPQTFGASRTGSRYLIVRSHQQQAWAQRRCFSQSCAPFLQTSTILQALRPRKQKENEPEEEAGLAFRSEDLTPKELGTVFGPVFPPVRKTNQLLRILHGRRNDGTLDLPLSLSVQELLKQYPFVEQSALWWLRQNYPLDEDAAIIARLEREEIGQEYSPSELEQRGQDIGLYGPQSGHYHARLSESDREGDVWGRSELERIRAENEAKAEEEEKEFQAEIDRKMEEAQLKQEQAKLQLQQQEEAKQQQPNKNALETRPEQVVSTDVRELRPPNEFEKWIMRAYKQGSTKLDLDSPEIADLTFARRILPSAFFVALICIGCYLYAQYWTPPRRADRMYPDVSLTYTTLTYLALINVFVYCAWRFPPLWSALNKYFIMTPAFPRALSMLGSTFSHQKPLHLINNMAALAILGSSLHEEVGRGTFLAIYIAGGAVGSLSSLLWSTTRGVFITSSLGASGSVCAIIASLLWLNANQAFTLFFLPEDLKEMLEFKGWYFLTVLLLYEGVSLLKPIAKIDHAGHLGGMLAGFVAAQGMKMNMDKKEEEQVGKGTRRSAAEIRETWKRVWDTVTLERWRNGQGVRAEKDEKAGGGDMGKE